MWRYLSKSLLLLCFSVGLCCLLYPLLLWSVGQAFFPFQANGSLLPGPDGRPVGSRLISQPFTRDEYFQPRPSAASYDAAASGGSCLAASNYALRDRVARTLGPIVTYASGPKAGARVGPEIESWFQQDLFQGQPHLVAQWAEGHPALARAWVQADPNHAAYLHDWAQAHPDLVARFLKDQTGTPQPRPEELAVAFFQSFSREHPGTFPVAVTRTGTDGRKETTIAPVAAGPEIQSTFFLLWREEHPGADLKYVPGDLATASASGLDPHITLKNAEFQLGRVAGTWAAKLSREPAVVHQEVQQVLQEHAAAPLWGLAGEKLVNALEVNLQLRRRYGAP